MLKKIIYPKLSYRITGICFQVQNELGRFAKERQYAERLEQLLKLNDFLYKREARVPYRLREEMITGNIIDFIVEGKIVLEIKAKPIVNKRDYFQVQRYLKATSYKLALLVNFRDRYLKPKRVLNYLNRTFVDSNDS